MAFIRQYALASGDPFSFRIPKKLRKLKIGRALGKVARIAAPVFGGPLGLLAGVAGGALGRQQQAEAAQVVDEEQADPRRETILAFARAFGLDMGDPRTGKGSTPKRKSAGAGPKAKAAKKAAKRATKASGPTAGEIARIAGKNVASALPAILAAGGKLAHGDFAGLTGTALGPLPKGMRGFGGHRRTMNPANVKALRRGIRRVEGFQKLVKKVEKAFPAMRRAHRGAYSAGARGHRKGCRCVACKAA